MAVVIAYLACALIWGTTWFAIRVSIAPGGYPTYASAAIRFSIAALVLGAIWALGARPGPRTPREWAWMVAAGLLNAAGYGFVYAAEEDIPGGLAAVLYGTAPLMMAVVAAVTRTELAAPRAVFGAMVAMLGIGVIFWDRLAVSSGQALGVVLMLGAVFSSTCYNVILKREARDQHPLASAGVFLAVTAVALWLVVLLRDPREIPWPPPERATAAVLYLAILGSVVAFTSYFFLLKRVRLMTATTLVFVQPILALGVDALWEQGVRIVARTYVGSGIVLAGVVLTLLVPRPVTRTGV